MTADIFPSVFFDAIPRRHGPARWIVRDNSGDSIGLIERPAPRRFTAFQNGNRIGSFATKFAAATALAGEQDQRRTLTNPAKPTR